MALTVKRFVVLRTLKTEDLWILEHVTPADVTRRPEPGENLHV